MVLRTQRGDGLPLLEGVGDSVVMELLTGVTGLARKEPE
jgi:hypothetical protein